MKILNRNLFLVLISLFLVVPGWCDPVDELLEIDKKLIALSESSDAESLQLEVQLRVLEARVFKRLFQSKEALGKFVKLSNQFSADLGKRFIGQLQFEISHGNRSDLQPILDAYKKVRKDESSMLRRISGKIAYVYGCAVNLRDGEWRHTPDGKRFWVSNGYPEIVLTPAEYRRYFQSAKTVEY